MADRVVVTFFEPAGIVHPARPNPALHWSRLAGALRRAPDRDTATHAAYAAELAPDSGPPAWSLAPAEGRAAVATPFGPVEFPFEYASWTLPRFVVNGESHFLGGQAVPAGAVGHLPAQVEVAGGDPAGLTARVALVACAEAVPAASHSCVTGALYFRRAAAVALFAPCGAAPAGAAQ